MPGRNIGNQIEEQIKESLQIGLRTGNFSELKQTIKDSTKEVIMEAADSIADSVVGNRSSAAPRGYKSPHSTPDASKAYTDQLQAQRKAHNAEVARQQAQLQAQREAQKRAKEAQKRKYITSNNQLVDSTGKLLPTPFVPVGKVAAPVCIATGAVGTVAFGITTIVKLVGLIFSPVGVGATIATGILAGLSGLTLKLGVDHKNLLDRAVRYAQICGNSMYSQITTLASAMGTKPQNIIKDVKKMLRRGFFPEGYLDDEETTLMVSSDIYKQYRITMNHSLQTDAAKTVKDLGTSPRSEESIKARSALTKEQVQELDAMVNEGRDYIIRLHKLNDEIPGEVISNKLDCLEKTLTLIFARVEEHPEQMERMHKLMDYYLPTALKLVTAYADYDKVSSPGKEIAEAKSEIEQTLDIINDAFTQLLHNLFTESVWDVTTDAQVLKTMLKNEGLTSD